MEDQLFQMGNRIKIRRKELKIKQTDLAELLDISNNHMSSIETGKQKPSLDIFMKICENCKAELNDDAIFCSKCGTKMSETKPLNEKPIETEPIITQPAVVETIKPKKSKKNIFIIVGVVATILIAVLLKYSVED